MYMESGQIFRSNSLFKTYSSNQLLPILGLNPVALLLVVFLVFFGVINHFFDVLFGETALQNWSKIREN